MLNFLLAMVVAAAPAPRTLTVSDAPVAPGLPGCVQKMSAEEYKAWAEWQNYHAAEKANERRWDGEQPTYTVNRTTITGKSSGYARSSMQGVTRTRVNRDKGGSRGTTSRNATTNRRQGARRTTTMATIPTRYRNPFYAPKPLMVYNPYVKSTSEREPDWNTLLVHFDGEVFSVAEVLKMLDHPMSPEVVFRLMMKPKEVISIER